MTTKTIRLPLNKVGTLNKIKKATSRLEQEFERPPSVEEIALKLDIPEHNLDKALRTRIRYVSVDTPIAEDEDTKFLDVFVSDDTPRTDNNLMRESLNKEIQRSLSTLTERERDVINLYYGIGMDHGLTFDEIGAELGLTGSYVSSLTKRAIKRLKRVSKSKNLKQFLE